MYFLDNILSYNIGENNTAHKVESNTYGKNFRKNEFLGMTCTHETFVLQSVIFENGRKICLLQEFFPGYHQNSFFMKI